MEGLVFGGWDAAEGGVEAVGVEPGDVLDDRELELGLGAPDAIADQFGLDGVNGLLSAEPGVRPRLALADTRSGPTPKRTSSNETSVSRTDPDAKLRGKPGQRPRLVHRGQVAVDPKARCVVACLGEQAVGFEGDAVDLLLDRARFACPDLVSVGADQGFAAERVWTGTKRRAIEAFIPPQRTMLAAGGPKTEAQRHAHLARERCKTDRGVWAHKRRMAGAEGAIGELKNQGNLDGARCRGTPLFHVQLLIGCTAINMKRLTSHDAAANRRAAGPASGEVVVLKKLGTVAQSSLHARIAGGALPADPSGGRHAMTAPGSYTVSPN